MSDETLCRLPAVHSTRSTARDAPPYAYRQASPYPYRYRTQGPTYRKDESRARPTRGNLVEDSTKSRKIVLLPPNASHQKSNSSPLQLFISPTPFTSRTLRLSNSSPLQSFTRTKDSSLFLSLFPHLPKLKLRYHGAGQRPAAARSFKRNSAGWGGAS